MKYNTKVISPIDLSTFQKPVIAGNRSVLWRLSWYLVSVTLFQSLVLGLIPGRVKACILRLFGAQVGAGFVCKPRVSIKYPWFLEIGENVWIGENAWIDNHCLTKIGNNVCISQGVYVFTGNHDWNDVGFSYFSKPVEIGNHVWITAFQRISPGSIIPDRTVVLPRTY